MGDPIPKGRPKFARRGKFVSVYTPKKTAGYEKAVGLLAKMAMQGRPAMPDAVSVSVRAFFAIPSSWSKKKRLEAMECKIYPTSKKDVDNICKSVLDGMNGIVFVDDGQVVDLTVSKRYSENPRVEIVVLPVEAEF